MLIRKNTKAFKTILEIFSECQDRPDREKLIRLYITRAGQSISDRISVEGIEGEAALFYEMNYQAVLNNLRSSNHQLNQSDNVPGIFFFHSTSNKVWDETPFEFDEVIKKEFRTLPDLPAVRKKEKAEKFVLPTPKTKSKSKAVRIEKARTKKVESRPDKGSKQPDYELKHKIDFTDLEKIVFRQAGLSKKDVLDYYYKIADYILPYLKDRPLSLRMNAGGKPVEHSNMDMLAKETELPAWIQEKSSSKHGSIICNDTNHLLYYVEIGCVQFSTRPTKLRSQEMPDYLLIGIESPETAIGKVIDVALAAKEILSGLKLPSFVMTDGTSGLHLYIPLDGKSDFETGRKAGEYICKLIRIKAPDLVTVKGLDEYAYGKVSLDYSINDERQSAIVPYSLVHGEAAIVATPLQWEEVNEDLRPEHFNHQTIFRRLEGIKDPFANLFKKKINGEDLLQALEENYSFLF